MSEHMAVFFCPYCGGEDLRPHETSYGSWACRYCARVFTVKFVGLLNREAGPLSVEAGK